MKNKSKWLVFGEDKDVFLCVDKITFFRKMWSSKNEKHYTRIFLSGDKFYYEEWDIPFEEIKETIIALTEED
jgi:hypothetical protein